MADFIQKVVSSIAKLFTSSKYHWDDILYIARPVVYVYSVMQYGRQSYTPIKISLVMDLITIYLLIQKLQRSGKKEGEQSLKSVERREIMRRIWEILIKYLIRDPIFDKFTK